MNTNTPTTTDELFRRILEILPDAEIDECLDGQLIVYTGLIVDVNSPDEERLVKYSELTCP